MKLWTMTRAAYYDSTDEFYAVTTVHKTYRGAMRSARQELEFFSDEYCEGESTGELLAIYAACRRRGRPDGNWFDSAEEPGPRVVIAIDLADVEE